MISGAKHYTIAFVTDAYGGRGGIAKFNRDLFDNIAEWNGLKELVVLPRVVPDPAGHIPAKISYDQSGTHGKFSYILCAIRASFRLRLKIDSVICGHVNLLPLAWLVSKLCGAKIWLIIHGIDAWQPTNSRLINALIPKVNGVISVSKLTSDRFSQWSSFPLSNIKLIHNSYDPALFFPKPRRLELIERYGLHEKVVLLTFGRLDSFERYKGFDEVIDILPELIKSTPNIVYLIAGDGKDKPRLESKINALGLTKYVIFTGYVHELEKPDLYQLADVYVMPSRGEGFGIVFLEAMACGIPAIGSCLDGSREALADGKLGRLVDPRQPQELVTAIDGALADVWGTPPAGLEEFSIGRIRERTLTFCDQNL